MFNPDPMLKTLEKVSSSFPLYVLTAPATPATSSRVKRPLSNFKNIQESIKRLASKKLKEKLAIHSKKKTGENSPKRTPRYLELIHLYNKKPTIESPREIKLNSARAVFTRPCSSKASTVCLFRKKRISNSRLLQVTVPQVYIN